MTLNRSDSDAGTPRRRAWPVIMVAVAFFGLLATLPLILPALHLQLHPAAPSSRYGVALTVAPRSPQPVRVPDVATPIDPTLPAAARPATNPARETATLSADDQRLRVMLHDAASVYQPEVVPVRGSLPTLILTAGQGQYTAATLVQYGALVMLPHQSALLLDNVYVSTNATLSLGGPAVRTLLVTGNTVGGHPSSGFAVGPRAPATVLAGNAVDGARTAFLIRTAGPVEMDTNLVTNATVFGVSSRGASSVVTGTGNTLAGTGFRATDAREGAPMPALYATNTAGWTVHTPVTFLTYLEFHPLAAMWLGVVALGALAFAWSRMRRIPSHPYPASTQWAGGAWAGTTTDAANAAKEVQAGKEAEVAREDRGDGAPEPPAASRSYAAAGRTGAARWAGPGSPGHASEPFQRGNPASPARSTREGRS